MLLAAVSENYKNMDNGYLYKILDHPPPDPLPITLPTTDLDAKDGFIHLSTAQQTPVTADLFFSNHNELWVLKLDRTAIDGRLEYTTDPNAGFTDGCAHVHDSKRGLGFDNIVEVLHLERRPEDRWTDVESMKDLPICHPKRF